MNLKDNTEGTGTLENNNFFNPDAFFDSIFNSFNKMFNSRDGQDGDHHKRKRKKQCCSSRCCEALFIIIGILIISSIVIFAFDPYGIVEIIEDYAEEIYEFMCSFLEEEQQKAHSNIGIDSIDEPLFLQKS